MSFFQAFLIHDPALVGMVFHDLPRPFAKLHRTGIVDLKSNSDDQLKRVMLQFSVDLSSPLGLNYPEIPDSCLLRQFVVVIYFLRDRYRSSSRSALDLRRSMANKLMSCSVMVTLPSFKIRLILVSGKPLRADKSFCDIPNLSRSFLICLARADNFSSL